MTKLFISTIPFASTNKAPLDLLDELGIDYEINPYGRKITEEELLKEIVNIDGLIAGTEPITKKVLNNADKLKVISRVGVGTDNIDLKCASKKNIDVRISSQGPINAVAEYTIGLILSSLRGIHTGNRLVKEGTWKKIIGKDLSNCVIGVIGAGNIGKKVIKLLSSFTPVEIIFFDPYAKEEKILKARKVSFNEILQTSDVLTLHLPLTNESYGLIKTGELKKMKRDAVLINTARGGIVNEEDLFNALKSKLIAGAAIDVFEKEPYFGGLVGLDNCLVSPHMAPMTESAREMMELDAIKQAIESLEI